MANKLVMLQLTDLQADAIQMAIIDSLEANPPWYAETKEARLVCNRLMDALQVVRKALDE